jgi:hypothetical protein
MQQTACQRPGAVLARRLQLRNSGKRAILAS